MSDGSNEIADVCVVGAGAAGLTAAIFAAEAAPPGSRIVLLDSARKVGAKILVAGGGRCNVTHDVVRKEDYNASSLNIVRNVLRAFDERRTVDWFADMGVTLKREETGKLFPTTDQARTVLDALVRRTAHRGVQLIEGRKVWEIAQDNGDFTVIHGDDRARLRARRVVLATGGRSLPKTGSDGWGWEIVRRLGHTVTPTRPALVPLVLDGGFFHASLAGVTMDAELTTVVDGRVINRRTGSLLWTHFGVSGPVAMDASRHWTTARNDGQSPELRCSLLPGRAFEHLEVELIALAEQRPKAQVVTVISSWLTERVARAVAAYAGVPDEATMSNLTRDARRRLVHALTALPLPVTSDRGWNYAEVTAGGVPLDEINYRRMESRLVPHLYLAGEILDCDGRIGGFNFQWAWSTGHLAGTAAGVSLTGA